MSAIMKKPLLPLAISLLCTVTAAHADTDCSKLSGCPAKQCELEMQIDRARKEGSMRKLATLKELRSEFARCTDKPESLKK